MLQPLKYSSETAGEKRAAIHHSISSVRCIYCGRLHEIKKKKCPALGHHCKEYDKLNHHFINMCQSNNKKKALARQSKEW